jgi:hypothetical protein
MRGRCVVDGRVRMLEARSRGAPGGRGRGRVVRRGRVWVRRCEVPQRGGGARCRSGGALPLPGACPRRLRLLRLHRLLQTRPPVLRLRLCCLGCLGRSGPGRGRVGRDCARSVDADV